MGSRRDRARVMGWLGVAAVLSNLLAGVVCMAPAKAVGLVDDIYGPLVLGTEHGPQAVPGSDPAGGGGQDQRQGKSSHCTACTLLAGLALAVALAVAAIVFPACIFHPFRSA